MASRKLNMPTLPANLWPDMLIARYHEHGPPTVQEAHLHLPFVDQCELAKKSEAAVIKLTNIPYETSKAAIDAFLTGTAQMVNQPQGSGYYAIHLILHPESGKSLECYVELESKENAEAVINMFTRKHGNLAKKSPFLHGRKIRIDLSDQAELMSALFAKTRGVTFEAKDKSYTVSYNCEKFDGLVCKEFLTALCRWARTPNKSRYISAHPQRPFESMMSILAKFPWSESRHITLSMRDFIFGRTFEMVDSLVAFLKSDKSYDHVVQCGLTRELLTQFLHNALAVPGFSEGQRYSLAAECALVVDCPIYLSPLAKDWPFHMIRRTDQPSEELVTYWASLFRQGYDDTEMEVQEAIPLFERNRKALIAALSNRPYANAGLPNGEGFGEAVFYWEPIRDVAPLRYIFEKEWEALRQHIDCSLNAPRPPPVQPSG